MEVFNMYREDISNYIGEGILLLPKEKGLVNYVERLLPEIGVDPDGTLKNGGKVELEWTKGISIPRWVTDYLKKGTPAYGLLGDDQFDEYMLGNKAPLVVLNTYDWFDKRAEYNRPALCLMSRGKTKEGSVITVNEKYQNTSRIFLDQRFEEYLMKLYPGNTEKTVAKGFSEACIDIVYSGSERKRQGLNVEEIIRFSDISLIGGNIEEVRDLAPDYKKRGGLLPVVTQDCKTNEVLMLAYVNEEALEKTIRTGYATFYSTSRQKLWTKGESSGNQMIVKSIVADCDQDAFLYKVETFGGACHTTDLSGNKRRSCFYRSFDM